MSAKNINIAFFITTILLKQAKDKKIDITLDAYLTCEQKLQ